MRPRAALGLLAVGLLLGCPLCADGEEPEPSRLEARVFDVAALTAGLTDFFAPSMGVCVRGLEAGDPSLPCHFGDGAEPRLPLGTAEEVRERLISEAAPASWFGSARHDIRSSGGTRLWARTTPGVHQTLGGLLAGWEATHLRAIAVEVVVFRAPDGDTAASLESQLGAGTQAASVSFSMLEGQRAYALDGRRRAFPAKHHPLAGTHGARCDPEVGVVTTGLLVDCRPTLSPTEDGVHLDLTVHWVKPRDSVVLRDAAGRPTESPRTRMVTARTALSLVPGRWSRLPVEGQPPEEPSWGFAVRASAVPRPARAPAPARGTRVPTIPDVTERPLEARTFDISRFQRLLPPVSQLVLGEVLPSGETPWTPHSLWREGAPSAILPADTLAHMVRELSDDPSAWDGMRALTAGRTTLVARAPGPLLDGLAELLQCLEGIYLRPVEIEVRVVDVPRAILVGAGSTLSEPQERALAASLADGTARVLDHGRGLSFEGRRVTLQAGDREPYVRDLETPTRGPTVELVAERMPLLHGMVIDVAPALVSTHDSVVSEVRFLHSRVARPLARVVLPEGEIELPDAGMLRVNTTLEIPLGSTCVLVSAGRRERCTLVLISARRSASPER